MLTLSDRVDVSKCLAPSHQPISLHQNKFSFKLELEVLPTFLHTEVPLCDGALYPLARRFKIFIQRIHLAALPADGT